MSVDFWIGAAVGVPLLAITVLAVFAARWLNDHIEQAMAFALGPKRGTRINRGVLIARRAKILRKALVYSYGFGFRFLGVTVMVMAGKLNDENSYRQVPVTELKFRGGKAEA